MKLIYSSALIILTIHMLWTANSALVSNEKKTASTELASALWRLVLMVAITVFASLAAMMLPFEGMALFFQTLHYASTEWMLIALLLFMEKYVSGCFCSCHFLL